MPDYSGLRHAIGQTAIRKRDSKKHKTQGIQEMPPDMRRNLSWEIGRCTPSLCSKRHVGMCFLRNRLQTDFFICVGHAVFKIGPFVSLLFDLRRSTRVARRKRGNPRTRKGPDRRGKRRTAGKTPQESRSMSCRGPGWMR